MDGLRAGSWGLFGASVGNGSTGAFGRVDVQRPLRVGNVHACAAQGIQNGQVHLRAHAAQAAIFRIAQPVAQGELQPVGAKVVQQRGWRSPAWAALACLQAAVLSVGIPKKNPLAA